MSKCLLTFRTTNFDETTLFSGDANNVSSFFTQIPYHIDKTFFLSRALSGWRYSERYKLPRNDYRMRIVRVNQQKIFFRAGKNVFTREIGKYWRLHRTRTGRYRFLSDTRTNPSFHTLHCYAQLTDVSPYFLRQQKYDNVTSQISADFEIHAKNRKSILHDAAGAKSDGGCCGQNLRVGK